MSRAVFEGLGKPNWIAELYIVHQALETWAPLHQRLGPQVDPVELQHVEDPDAQSPWWKPCTPEVERIKLGDALDTACHELAVQNDRFRRYGCQGASDG